MHVLHQCVDQSASDKCFCVTAKALKECGAVVMECRDERGTVETRDSDLCICCVY